MKGLGHTSPLGGSPLQGPVTTPHVVVVVTLNPPAKPQEGFCSTWAHEMQQELERAATAKIQLLGRKHQFNYEDLEDVENTEKVEETNIPDCWEDREPLLPAFNCLPLKQKLKVRKPGWLEVDRKKKSEEKRKKLKNKRKARETECLTKSGHMAGLGPIRMSDVTDLMARKHIGFEEAKVRVLADQLGYNSDELDELSVVETKFATKGENVLYVAMSLQEHIKKIHMRKAESWNNHIIVRNYVHTLLTHSHK